MRKIWEEFYNCIKIISRYFNFCIYIYMNNRCRLSARTPFCAQRRERHKMEDSRFSTSPSSVRADDDDPDKRNLALWWKRGSCGMASRATVFVEVHSDYGLSVACRPLEWKSSNVCGAIEFVTPRLRVYSGETRTIFLSVRIHSILNTPRYISPFTFDMDIAIFRIYLDTR